MYCLSADSPAAQTKWQTKVRAALFILGSSDYMNGYVEGAAVSFDFGPETGFNYGTGGWRRRQDEEKSLCLWTGRETLGQEDSSQAGGQVRMPHTDMLYQPPDFLYPSPKLALEFIKSI